MSKVNSIGLICLDRSNAGGQIGVPSNLSLQRARRAEVGIIENDAIVV